MQRSLKYLCEATAIECVVKPLRQLDNGNCGQFSLLGIQIGWTQQCFDALSKAKQNKQFMIDNNRLRQFAILQDLGSRMNRVKKL